MRISVIIPVYNAEDYLEECIDSILAQEYTDYEILLINDGSTDSSGTICDDYAKKDQRVKVFHKVNGGVSTARNLGIENAKGEWITFVDSDDFISNNYFDPVEEYHDQDFIMLSSNKVNENNESSPFLSFKPQKLKLETFLKQYQLNPHFSSPWAKFFKRSLIIVNNIKFDENMSLGEDSVFCLEYIFKCSKIALTDISSYNYRLEARGLSKSRLSLKEEEYLFNRTMSVFQQQHLENDVMIRSMKVPLLRYLFKILNSKLNKDEKIKRLKELINLHQTNLITVSKGQRVHLIPLSWLIKFEAYNLLVYFFKEKQ